MKSMLIKVVYISSLLLFTFCSTKEPVKPILNTSTVSKQTKEFKAYWYRGAAEITSYKLTQARYGEIHEGTAVNVYVTEEFLPKKQVKADNASSNTIPILKLNSTKKFITGIYPYSIMTSTFSPVNIRKKALKISFSAQEWCGNTFLQLNNRDNFKIDFHSYFEQNSDAKIALKKEVLENELWNIMRISPKDLPIGNLKMIPAFEFLALNHKEIKAYKASTKLTQVKEYQIYTINYPTLKRTLSIKINTTFPFHIQSWQETLFLGGKTCTTKAEKINTIQSAYWNKNGVLDTEERKELGLK